MFILTPSKKVEETDHGQKYATETVFS